MQLEAEPEAIFFPKFENSNEPSREQYRKLAAAGKHVLVAAVKSSGSLFLVTARAGVLVVASKNGMGNVYADCGHLVLICHLQQAHGAEWGQAYQDLARLLEDCKLSLGCELVTRSLGDHAETPAQDHLVVNAVLDRRTMAAASPLLVLRICHNFGLVAPGMYMFRGPDAFERFHHTYESMRWKLDATWDELHLAMSEAAWRVSPMPYSELHSQNLEGYVCSWIPLSCELEKWAAQPDAARLHQPRVSRADSGLRLNSLASVLLSPGVDSSSSSNASHVGGGEPLQSLDEMVAALRTQHPSDTSRQRLHRLQPCVRKQLQAHLSTLDLPSSSTYLATANTMPGAQNSVSDVLPDSGVRETSSREVYEKLERWLFACRPSAVHGEEANRGDEARVGGGAQWGARGFMEMVGMYHCPLSVFFSRM